MRFTYCPDCGAKLSHRDLGDEKDVPWCDNCNRPFFPVFPCATISLVYNDKGDVLLLKQNYISSRFRNLVSGYMLPGEDAATCARREIKEETGLDVERLELIRTDWFEKSQVLMIGFFAKVPCDESLKLSVEVDGADWFAESEILHHLSDNPGSTSRRLAESYLSRKGLITVK